jgi:hypothetical protein
MNNLGLLISEGVSAALAFILVRFMIKPYRITGENRYLGLPLGFAFMGMSYIFMGASLFISDPSIAEKMQWLQLFTGAYAFVFLAVTYYFSAEKHEQKAHPLMQALISLMFLVLVFIFTSLFLPPLFALPSYKATDEYFKLFNIILALYITFHTLRSHVLKPEAKTIPAPLAYALLAFSQYSFLIWSIDSSFSAFVGAHVIRIASLLVLLYVSYKAIVAPQNAINDKSGPK